MAWQSLLPYIPAITKGLTTGLGYAFRPKRRAITPRFAETEYGGLLQRRAREGTISPRVRGSLLGRYGRLLGGEEQRQRAGISGGLVSRGAYGSISGLRALGEPGRRRMGLLGEYGKELDIESEMGKRQAEEELARLSTEWAMQRRAEEEQRRLEGAQARMGLLGGLGEAGLGLYRGLMGKKLIGTDLEPYYSAAEAGIKLPYYAGRGLMEESPEEKQLRQLKFMQEVLDMFDQGWGRE